MSQIIKTKVIAQKKPAYTELPTPLDKKKVIRQMLSIPKATSIILTQLKI
jgi:hypothetical protein